MYTLPKVLLSKIGLYLSLTDLYRFSLANKQISRIMDHQNTYFWSQRLLNDFPDLFINSNCKDLYKKAVNTGTIYTFDTEMKPTNIKYISDVKCGNFGYAYVDIYQNLYITDLMCTKFVAKDVKRVIRCQHDLVFYETMKDDVFQVTWPEYACINVTELVESENLLEYKRIDIVEKIADIILRGRSHYFILTKDGDLYCTKPKYTEIIKRNVYQFESNFEHFDWLGIVDTDFRLTFYYNVQMYETLPNIKSYIDSNVEVEADLRAFTFAIKTNGELVYYIENSETRHFENKWFDCDKKLPELEEFHVASNIRFISAGNNKIVAITLNDELYSFQHANFTKISNNVKTVDLLDDITVALVYTRSMHNYF